MSLAAAVKVPEIADFSLGKSQINKQTNIHFYRYCIDKLLICLDYKVVLKLYIVLLILKRGAIVASLSRQIYTALILNRLSC